MHKSLTKSFFTPAALTVVLLVTFSYCAPAEHYGSYRPGSGIDAYRQPSGHERGGGGGGVHGYGGYRGHVGGGTGGGSGGGGDYAVRYGDEASQKASDAQKDSKYYYGGQYKGINMTNID